MEQVWFTQGEAARYLRFSLAFFRRHVHPTTVVYVENAPRYARGDLDGFMARKKIEAFRPKRRSPTKAATSTPKVERLLKELTRKSKRKAA